ncbi:MAG: DUF1922 domain-containing protein [Methanogenium sp.]
MSCHFRHRTPVTKVNNLGEYISDISMYLIVRCENCYTFSYMDRFQKWKLCPVCGGTMERGSVPEYLEVADHHEAEAVIAELERYLYENKRTDFTLDETEKLRAAYIRRVSSSVENR